MYSFACHGPFDVLHLFTDLLSYILDVLFVCIMLYAHDPLIYIVCLKLKTLFLVISFFILNVVTYFESISLLSVIQLFFPKHFFLKLPLIFTLGHCTFRQDCLFGEQTLNSLNFKLFTISNSTF